MSSFGRRITAIVSSGCGKRAGECQGFGLQTAGKRPKIERYVVVAWCRHKRKERRDTLLSVVVTWYPQRRRMRGGEETQRNVEHEVKSWLTQA